MVLGLILSTGSAIAQDEDSTDSNISADLEKLNVTRTNDSNITRHLKGAVSGVDGRVISQEPAKVVAGVEGGIVGQETPAAAITTEPPITTPEPIEKPACGPTTLLALAILPLMFRRKNQ